MGAVGVAESERAGSEPGPGTGAAGAGPKPLEPGTRVDVRDRFQGRWTRGFVVAEATEDSYRLRRLSDDSVLPGVFAHDSVRRERGRHGTWWF